MGTLAQQKQPPPNQHFDQYHDTGLDYPNQPPDPFFGDSQNQEDRTSWGQGTESASESYSQASQSRSGSSATSSFSEASSGSQNPELLDQRDYLNNNVEVVDEDESRSSRSHSSDPFIPHQDKNEYVDFESAASSRDGSNASAESHVSRDPFYEEEVFEGASSRDGSDASGSNYSEVQDFAENNYGEAEIYEEEDQSWIGAGSTSSGTSASKGLPPIT